MEKRRYQIMMAFLAAVFSLAAAAQAKETKSKTCSNCSTGYRLASRSTNGVAMAHGSHLAKSMMKSRVQS